MEKGKFHNIKNRKMLRRKEYFITKYTLIGFAIWGGLVGNL